MLMFLSSAAISVPPGGAEHLLPEVCVVDASGTLPSAAPPGLFCQRGRGRHEGNLRLHGWPVSSRDVKLDGFMSWSCSQNTALSHGRRLLFYLELADNTVIPNDSFCRLIRKFHKKLGQQAWLVAAITVTEFLIVVKYDPNTIMLPIPFFIMQCWFLGLVLIITWTVWRFFIR